MSTDERVRRLSEKFSVKLNYSNELVHEMHAKPDIVELRKLAAEIRKTLKETAVDTLAHPYIGSRS